MCTSSDFTPFVNAMRGRTLLHVGHRDADCDAVAAAYAMNSILPGDIGFAQGLKASAQALVDWLRISPVIDPDPLEYEYTLIYDSSGTERGINRKALGLALLGSF